MVITLKQAPILAALFLSLVDLSDITGPFHWLACPCDFKKDNAMIKREGMAYQQWSPFIR